jgi:hypothetical protein
MDIALSKKIPINQLTQTLCSFFNNQSVYIGDILGIVENTSEVFNSIEINKSEFPFGLSIQKYPKQINTENFQQMTVLLSYYLSKCFNCLSICDGTGYGDHNSPYLSIIWDTEIAFLADDSDTLFADGEGGKVKIIKKLNLNNNEMAKNLDLNLIKYDF